MRPRHPPFTTETSARALGLLASVLLCCSAAAEAQEPAVGPRARVRVTPAGGEARLIGMVEALRGDSLVLELTATGERRAIHLPSVARLEVSRGVHGRPAKGALLGAAVGIAFGALLGAGSSDDECDVEVCIDLVSREEAIVIGAVVAGLAGTAVGAVIGSLSRTERWMRVPVPGATSD